jgi:ActR/RegA family two-component response regulator
MNRDLIVVAHERPLTVHTLVTAFTAAGYEAVGALTFRDAIDVVSDCRPSVLVVNLELGAFNGLHLALRCASDFPWLKIVVLGPANDAVEDEARQLGAFAYVARPASPETIVEQTLAVLVASPATLPAAASVTHV